MKLKLLLITFALLLTASASFAQTSSVSPDNVVRNLYAAHKKTSTTPFFQTRSRARVDRFFVRELAELIWKDAKSSKGEVGNIDFDPLYNAQDIKISGLKVGKPTISGTNAEVKVTFRNWDSDQTVVFKLKQSAKIWKIADIVYPSVDTSLMAILKS